MKQFVICSEVSEEGECGDVVWVNLDYVQNVYPYVSFSEDLSKTVFVYVVEDCDGNLYTCSVYDNDCRDDDGSLIPESRQFDQCILTFGNDE